MKKNRIILTTSVKGGVGKTQICATAASYFLRCFIPVTVVDADTQQSIYRHRQRDLAANPSALTPWDVIKLDTSNIDGVKAFLERIKKLPFCFLIDCPGNVESPALSLIYEAADVVIVPFELNSDSVDATVMFAKVFKKHFKAKMFFVPNKVSAVFEKRGEVRKAREDATEALEKKYGTITPDIMLTTHMNGYSTLSLPTNEVKKAVKEAFSPFFVPIWKIYRD